MYVGYVTLISGAMFGLIYAHEKNKKAVESDDFVFTV
jgi:hypothetical protein